MSEFEIQRQKKRGRKFFLQGDGSLEQGAKRIFRSAPCTLPPTLRHILPGPFFYKKGGVPMQR